MIFKSKYQYGLHNCATANMPTQPPVEDEKIWTISKTETHLIISCNGVEVLNARFASYTGWGGACSNTWAGDVVEEIIFTSSDTASDFYRSLRMYSIKIL